MQKKNDLQSFVLNVAQFQSQNVIQSLTDPEEYLFNIVASCLMNEVRYYDDADSRRLLLLLALNKVAETSPEFVLQLALYLRNELYVRTTTNFILAFAAFHPKTRPFLKKYFSKSVILPTDLIEVCQFAQLMNYLNKNKNLDLVSNGKNQNFSLQKFKEIDQRKKLKFPKALMKCVQDKFKEFNVYQLGKYCSENNRKRLLFNYLQAKDFDLFTKKKQQVKERIKTRLLQKVLKEKGLKMEIEPQKNKPSAEKQDEKKNQVAPINKKSKLIQKYKQKHQKVAKVLQPKTYADVKYISMKDIVSLCHVKTPQFLVKSVLGKKYPETEQQFDAEFGQEKQKLKLKFDQGQVKKRMKIQTPVTWETELSAKGNKPEVWTELIMSNKLPYMAMMRNLRNILKSGVPDYVHQKIMDKISDPDAVFHAKMFPFQYFSAMEAIYDVLIGENSEGSEHMFGMHRGGRRGRGGRGRGGFLNKKMDLEVSDSDEEEKKESQDQGKDKINKEYGNQYINCINKALNIAVEKNLDEIQGHTVIFSDVSGSMRCAISGNSQKYGSVRECFEVGLLLGLMIRKKCKNCSFYIFSSPRNEGKCYKKVDLEDEDYLTNMQILKAESENLGGGTDFPIEVIQELKAKNIKVDNIVILSDMMISVGHSDIGNAQQFLRDYLIHCNPNLKIFSVDLRGYGQQIQLTDEFNEKNYIRIFGMSDNILRFISVKERNQIAEIKCFAEAFLAKKD